MKSKDSKTEQILLSFYLKELQKDKKFVRGKKLNPVEIKRISKIFLEKLHNPKVYKSFSIRNDTVEKLVIAFQEDHIFMGKCIVCWQLRFSKTLYTSNAVKEENFEIRKFFRASKKPIYLNVNLRDREIPKTLVKAGFETNGVLLVGKISDGLKAVRSKSLELAEDFDLRKPRRSEFHAILKTELKAHRAEPTSVVKRTGDVFRKSFKGIFENLVKHNLIFAVYNENNVPVAHMGVFAPTNKSAAIMTIAIQPEYWGQGLSYILYEAGFERMKELGASRYEGFTSTTKVLNLSKKLKRKPHEYIMINKN